ncbi:type II toxin-antitoxin system HigB family toxin [Bradyrhizobium lablabi]|uniref:type II toxin-antitoxin system HigB family toxin n=1 Tax=Bradyrhizobium lablabi TaxID=722472 RepID=UPI0009A59894|nr:type II toxin-antitoxin system HigB family toxin [Bradyrhizobium lablabi]
MTPLSAAGVGYPIAAAPVRPASIIGLAPANPEPRLFEANIKGNDYRLVVAADFDKGIVWIKWIGLGLSAEVLIRPSRKNAA